VDEAPIGGADFLSVSRRVAATQSRRESAGNALAPGCSPLRTGCILPRRGRQADSRSGRRRAQAAYAPPFVGKAACLFKPVRKVRCGVVGVGSLGQHHARIYAQLPGSELIGVYDTDRRRAAEIAGSHGCRAFGGLEELGGACEAVSVVVPTSAHAKTALSLLAKGCHVLVEKPLCASIEEAEEVLAAANVNGRLVQVGHVEHFNPVMSYLEKEASNPKYITAERLAPYKMRGVDVGVVLDLMIHDIGIVLALAKAPLRRIDSVGINVLSKTEDIANARLEFENGCVANLSASRISMKASREIRIFQENAYLSLDFMNQKGHLIKKSDIIAYGLKLKVGLATPGDFSAIPVHPIPIEKGEPLAIELAHFVESVGRASQPKVGAELGKSALEIAIRITEQIRAARRGGT
jgi:predicted dehydrogenase